MKLDNITHYYVYIAQLYLVFLFREIKLYGTLVSYSLIPQYYIFFKFKSTISFH